MKSETDKGLDKQISKGKALWISSFIYDAIDCRVEIGFTPDPDHVACDRKMIFRAVSEFRAKRYHDSDDICYGNFMGIHREVFQPAGSRAEFVLNTGDAEIQFHAATDVEVIFLPHQERK